MSLLLAIFACGCHGAGAKSPDGSVDAGADLSAVPSDAATGDAATGEASDAATVDAGAFNGALSYVFCDIKKPLAGQNTQADQNLSESNYQTVLTALKQKLGCNGIRFYIDTTITDPTMYPQLYTDVFGFARSDLGLEIYANPLNTGSFGLTDASYASLIVAYANQFKPEFIGPFNESGLGVTRLETIAGSVRAGLTYGGVLVGPDVQKVDSSIDLAAAPGLSAEFDVFGSHNAVDDQGATIAAWTALQKAAGRTTWSTENPRPWSFLNDMGVEVGVKAVVNAPVHGLVLYEAFPNDVLVDGTLTAQGQGIVAGVLR